MNNEKNSNFVSVVVYVHDDGNRIEDWIMKISEWLDNDFKKSEIICVNDGSTDDSKDKIKGMISKISDSITLTTIEMGYFHGIENAMKIGTDLSIGDFVFEFDVINNSYSVDDIREVYKRALEGYDIVGATRAKAFTIREKVFYFLLNKSISYNNNIKPEAFRILSRRAINRINDFNSAFFYRKLLYARSGLAMSNISYADKEGTRDRDPVVTKYTKKLYREVLLIYTNIAFCTCMAGGGLGVVLTIFQPLFKPDISTSFFKLGSGLGIALLYFFLSIIMYYQHTIVSVIEKKKDFSYMSIEKYSKS